MKTIALLTFIAVYALLLLLPKYRAVSALSAAALFLLLRIVPLGDVAGTVDWNVLMMLAGTMGTVDLFIRSNMPNRLSDRLVAVLPSVKWLIIPPEPASAPWLHYPQRRIPAPRTVPVR